MNSRRTPVGKFNSPKWRLETFFTRDAAAAMPVNANGGDARFFFVTDSAKF